LAPSEALFVKLLWPLVSNILQVYIMGKRLNLLSRNFRDKWTMVLGSRTRH